MLEEARKSTIKLADFPLWMRALLLITVLLCFCNLILFLAPVPFVLKSYGLEINQGLATLIGAILGLSAIAYQTRIGFNNLMLSQQNQAKLERDARVHRRKLETEAKQAEQENERKVLVAALIAELSIIFIAFDSLFRWAISMQVSFSVSDTRKGAPDIAALIDARKPKTVIFDANIAKL